MFDFQYLQRMKEFGSYFMDESGAVIDGGTAAVVNHVADTA